MTCIEINNAQEENAALEITNKIHVQDEAKQYQAEFKLLKCYIFTNQFTQTNFLKNDQYTKINFPQYASFILLKKPNGFSAYI